MELIDKAPVKAEPNAQPMEPIAFLQQRVSYHVHELGLPAPSDEQLDVILQTAMSTPDHGHLLPWHFLVIKRHQVESLIVMLKSAWLATDSQLDTGRVNRLANYLQQAPMMVLISADIKDHPAVSKQDQILSAAAACQMTLLGADATGFGGVWYSTDAVDLPDVKRRLGLNDNQMPVGFLVLGTPLQTRLKKRKSVKNLTVEWSESMSA